MDQSGSGYDRALRTLVRLLSIDISDMRAALDSAADSIAESLNADKVDTFLYHPETDMLIADGTSYTPMSRKQIELNLDRIPIASGGRTVQVFQTGEPFISGHVDDDPEELSGISQDLGVRSQILVPLMVEDVRRGVLLCSSATPEFFSDGDLHFLAAVANWAGIVIGKAELTERLADEAMLRGRRAAAEELVTTLAHDLRNYLVPLRGRLDLIRRRAVQEDRSRDERDADLALSALQNLNRLITDLLDVSRLEQGIFAVSPKPVDLSRLVRETVASFELPGVPIVLQAPDDVIVEADPDRARQALANVLSNALKYSPPDAQVDVELRVEEGEQARQAVISVCDRGPGIPAELLPNLFERFSAGPGSSGLGLGLYLSRRILELHGGSISADVSTIAGATFRLTLPVETSSE